MTLTFEAIYENGVLKPKQPLPLKEHETVQVTVLPQTSWIEWTAWLLSWPGGVATLDCLIRDAELDPQEGP